MRRLTKHHTLILLPGNNSQFIPEDTWSTVTEAMKNISLVKILLSVNGFQKI